MAPPPELIPDAVAEILLRVPPGEPAHLLRASLVCKPWRRILTDQAFLRRYREFHGTPPLLGFIGIYYLDYRYSVPRIIPTTAASPFPQPALGCRGSLALDCRHGRVLLAMEEDLLVCDPVTGDRRRLRKPISSRIRGFSAAVLCAAAVAGGCDHLDCHGGPFLVVAVWAGEYRGTTWASVYSSETGAWSAATSVNGFCSSVLTKRGALVGNVICFTLLFRSIVMYDLDDHRLSLINCPDMPDAGYVEFQTMTMEDGSLGLAAVDTSSKFFLWSRNVDPNGAATWIQRRVIGIETMLPIDDSDNLAAVIGVAEGVGIIFVKRNASIFTVELKSGTVRKISDDVSYYSIVPFMSFYTPDCHCQQR